jgi:hypothetical protein
MIADAEMRQGRIAVRPLFLGEPPSTVASARDDGYLLSRRRNGRLQVEIDMVATPWPYNAWQWAAMLPDVRRAMVVALTGRAEPVVVSMGRWHNPRRVDVLLWLQRGQIRIENRRDEVEHQIQLVATVLRNEGSLMRVVAALVEVVLRAPTASVSVTTRLLPGGQARPAHIECARNTGDAYSLRAASRNASTRSRSSSG